MARLLHIIATPRGSDSRTLRVSRTLLERFAGEFPGGTVDTLDLFKEKVPLLRGGQAAGRYAASSGLPLEGEVRGRWHAVERQIRRFLAADIIVVSSPMRGFSVPQELKNYIDTIMQPGYTYYRAGCGADEPAGDQRVIVVSTRGEDFEPGSAVWHKDLLEPYLRTVFGSVGIWNLTFVNVQAMDEGGTDLEEGRIQEAMERARAVPMAEKVPVA